MKKILAMIVLFIWVVFVGGAIIVIIPEMINMVKDIDIKSWLGGLGITVGFVCVILLGVWALDEVQK